MRFVEGNIPIQKSKDFDMKSLEKHLTIKQRRRLQLSILANEPLSQRQIARVEGVSQQAICQSIQGAIKKLKKMQKKLEGIS